MSNVYTKNTELLAPAGSYDAFIASINAGADAVYMGLERFNARIMTNNFTIEEYIKAIDYAHLRGVKVYLTLNTLLLDNEIFDAVNAVYDLYKAGLDAVILQDVGVAKVIHELMPDLAMHASTQMSVCSLKQVEFLEKLGFTRVVLARELSIQEIEEIAQNTNLEIEVFVHGALCVSVSGQCLMSALIGGRSANRGNCAGTCRKQYSLYTSKNKLIQKNKYLLSKKDIFGLDKLSELKKAGVDSFKIEGRNKTVEYVAGTVKAYKEALLNDKVNLNTEKELLQLFNRSGKSDGYLNGVRYRQSISDITPKNTGLFLGTVLDVKKEYVKVKLEEKIDLHDGIEIEGNENISTIVTCIRDVNFNILNKQCKKGDIVYLGDIRKAKVKDRILKTSDAKLNSKYKEYAKLNLRKVTKDVTVEVMRGKSVTARTGNIKVSLEYIPEQSKTTSVTEEKIVEAFSKTENEFVTFNIKADIEDGLFVPTSKLNELRKELINKLEENILVRKEIKNFEQKLNRVLEIKEVENTRYKKEEVLFVYRYNPDTDYIALYKEKYSKLLDKIYITASDFRLHKEDIFKYKDKCKIYFVIPNVTLKNMTKYIDNNIEDLIKEGISGIVIGNIGYLDMCVNLKEKYGVKLVLDYSMNITNTYTSKLYKDLGIDSITPLFENDEIDVEKISKVIDIELVCDLATVMTTRYCVISSFAKDVTCKEECMAECTKNNYYVIDEHNKRYELVTDNLDCITRLVRNKHKVSEKQEEKYTLRRCII